MLKNEKDGLCQLCNGRLTWWGRARDWEYFTTPVEYEYYQCVSCLSLFLPSYNNLDLATIYPDQYYSFKSSPNNFAFRIKKWLDKIYLTKILKKISGSELSVLDIGGGKGEMLDIIKKIDKRVQHTTIVDINEICRIPSILAGHQFICSRIEDFQIDKRYDLILMFNLIEHIANPGNEIAKICELLTPTGICVVKTPNADSLDARLFNKSYWGGLHTPRHWTIFTETGLKKIIDQLPVTMKVRYTQGAPFWAYSMLVLLFGKKLLRKKNPLIEHPLFPVFSALFAVFDTLRIPFAKTSQIFIEIYRNVPLYARQT